VEILYQRTNLKIRLVWVIGLAAVAAFAAWQFYLFAVFKDATGVTDLQGGTVHLWLAIGTALLVCIGGFFLFSRFRRYDARDEMHITAQGHAPGARAKTKEV
jgi:hypothetical protein